MKRNLNIIIMLIILVTACTGRENIGEIPSNTVCASLVNAKCTRCHYKTRICAALGTKSISKWGKTINFMVNECEEFGNKIAFLSTPSIFYSLKNKDLKANSKVFDVISICNLN